MALCYSNFTTVTKKIQLSVIHIRYIALTLKIELLIKMYMAFYRCLYSYFFRVLGRTIVIPFDEDKETMELLNIIKFDRKLLDAKNRAKHMFGIFSQMRWNMPRMEDDEINETICTPMLEKKKEKVDLRTFKNYGLIVLLIPDLLLEYPAFAEFY